MCTVLAQNNDFDWHGVSAPAVSNWACSLAVMSSSRFNHTNYALEALHVATMDARNNWWGDASGPYHTGSNPSGLGDSVTGPVEIFPWLSEDPMTVSKVLSPLPTNLQLNVYPNPFNPSTEIHFDLPENAHVELTIFNTLGQKVATLLDEARPAGSYRVQWDGSGMASGVYLYQLRAGNFTETKRMVLMK
jgi:hypothetical protein